MMCRKEIFIGLLSVNVLIGKSVWITGVRGRKTRASRKSGFCSVLWREWCVRIFRDRAQAFPKKGVKIRLRRRAPHAELTVMNGSSMDSCSGLPGFYASWSDTQC